jgi:superoxide reductase
MALKLGIYKCKICGNVVEVFVEGKGDLVCCGEEMALMDEKNKEGAGEKHIPVIEKMDNSKVVVKVGSIPHPMDPDHWIQFIEVMTKDGYVLRKDLNPGDKPEATFIVDFNNIDYVREFCNKHGLWVYKM